MAKEKQIILKSAMSKKMHCIYNGQVLAQQNIVISPDNRSFKYGDGCFETMKMINNEIIFENLHFERLLSSLKTLQFDIPSHFTKEYFQQQVKELVIQNNHQFLSRIRLTVFRGDGNLRDDNDTPNYIIQSWQLPQFPIYNETGLNVAVYKTAQKTCDMFSNIKSNNYLPYAMASLWCKKNGFDDALILNCCNQIAEATTSNVFIVKDGIIKTPPLSEGCIAGVTRKYLLQSFDKENIVCKQFLLTEENIYDADEMFLTNSGFHIQWVKQCGTKFYTNELSKSLYQRFITPLLKGYEK